MCGSLKKGRFPKQLAKLVDVPSTPLGVELNPSKKVSHMFGATQLHIQGNIAWAFTTLSIRELPLLEAIAVESQRRMVEFNVQGMANSAWALAKVWVSWCGAFEGRSSVPCLPSPEERGNGTKLIFGVCLG